MAGEPLSFKQGVLSIHHPLEKVQDLMENDEKCWNSPIIWKFFKESTSWTLATHICLEEDNDNYVWSISRMGEVRIKEVYAFLQKQNGKLQNSVEEMRFWHKFPAFEIGPKWKFFIEGF